MMHALALSHLALHIEHAHLLLAKTLETARHVTLMVYRSVKVSDLDPIYAPVLDLLERTRATLLFKEIVKDKCMELNEAEWAMYCLWSATSPSELRLVKAGE